MALMVQLEPLDLPDRKDPREQQDQQDLLVLMEQ
jgi:hypothetical protein